MGVINVLRTAAHCSIIVPGLQANDGIWGPPVFQPGSMGNIFSNDFSHFMPGAEVMAIERSSHYRHSLIMCFVKLLSLLPRFLSPMQLKCILKSPEGKKYLPIRTAVEYLRCYYYVVPINVLPVFIDTEQPQFRVRTCSLNIDQHINWEWIVYKVVSCRFLFAQKANNRSAFVMQ